MAKDKVINLQAKREAKGEQVDPFQVQLPPEVVEAINKMEVHVQDLNAEIDNTLSTYSDTHNGPLDFSLPLEALTRSFLEISAEMDLQVLEEVLEAHHQMRLDLAEKVNDAVQLFMQQQTMPVYSQDIYIGVAFTLVSYLQQHRIFTQVRSYDKAKGEKTDGGSTNH